MTVSTSPAKPEPSKQQFRRRMARNGLLSLLAFLVIAGYFLYQRKRYHHFAVHEPGKVYRSAYLAPEVFAEVAKDYNIKTVVNLCTSDEKACFHAAEQRDALEQVGAKLVEIVFPSNSTWHTDDPSFRVMEEIYEDPANYPIWIHCVHGKERTVKALVIYDVKHRGMTARESLAAMPIWGNGHPWAIVAFSYAYETWFNQKSEGESSAVASQPDEATSQH